MITSEILIASVLIRNKYLGVPVHKTMPFEADHHEGRLESGFF